MKPSEQLTYGRPPWAHQIEFLDLFGDAKSAATFHEMGTGKTTSIIMWLRYKFKLAQGISPVLILTPVATLWNWEREFKVNAPETVSSKVTVLYGEGKKRVKIVQSGTHLIFITNYEALDNKDLIEEFKKIGFKYIVLDESHLIKNYKSKRFKTLLTFSDKAEYKLISTGSPSAGSYMDLWSQFRFLDNGKTLGKNFFVFRNQFFVDKNAGMAGTAKYFPNWQPKASCEDEITAKISSLSHRVRKEECLSLPPLVKTTRYIELNAEQQRLYKQMKKDLVVHASGGTCTASIALVKVARILQIIAGYFPVEKDLELWDANFDPETGLFKGGGEKVIHKIANNPRLAQLEEDLEAIIGAGHKVIVWTTHGSSYDDIIEISKKFSKKVAEITGRTKDKAEQNALFETDPECMVCVSNPQAGGTGINLIAAPYSIWYSRSWSLLHRLQAEARNYRGGSEIHESITLIDYVTKDTEDEAVLDALNRKDNFAENILERVRQGS